MTRLNTPASIQTSPAASPPQLEGVQKQLGVVPNLFRLLGNSPAALDGYLSFSGALAKGTLDARTRQRLALTVAELNGCSYCLSAHTAIGRHAGLSNDEMVLNRQGRSRDAKAAATVAFAQALNANLGEITGAEFAAARSAGLSDAEIVEVIAVVAINIFTNILGKATRVEIDFPKVELLRKAVSVAA